MQKLTKTMKADDAVRQTVRLRLIISAGVANVCCCNGSCWAGLAAFAIS